MTNYEAYMAMFGVKVTNGEAQAVFDSREKAEAFIEAFKVTKGPHEQLFQEGSPMTLAVEETSHPVTIRSVEGALDVMAGPVGYRDPVGDDVLNILEAAFGGLGTEVPDDLSSLD